MYSYIATYTYILYPCWGSVTFEVQDCTKRDPHTQSQKLWEVESRHQPSWPLEEEDAGECPGAAGAKLGIQLTRTSYPLEKEY